VSAVPQAVVGWSRTPSRLVLAGALAALLLALAPGAQARMAANPVLDVNFFTNDTIAVTLADGTPVGTASGTPTTIPAGYYTLVLTGPGGCANVPYFELHGPGASVVDNMDEGELATATVNAYLAPNSTYTWKNDDSSPPVLYTFTTSAQVLGTPPPVAGASGISAATHGTATSTNPIGVAPVKMRGTLNGAVSAAGKLTVAFGGKSVAKLLPGRYKVVIVDRSASNGFMLFKNAHKKLSVSGVKYVGTHTVTVTLTSGRWYLLPTLGSKKTLSIFVT
jgi:hypothetical protein